MHLSEQPVDRHQLPGHHVTRQNSARRQGQAEEAGPIPGHEHHRGAARLPPCDGVHELLRPRAHGHVPHLQRRPAGTTRIGSIVRVPHRGGQCQTSSGAMQQDVAAVGACVASASCTFRHSGHKYALHLSETRGSSLGTILLV